MPAPSQAEETLQMQVTQLNRQLADHRQQVNELSRQNHQLRQKPRSQSVPLRANSEDYETRALRQQVFECVCVCVLVDTITCTALLYTLQ